MAASTTFIAFGKVRKVRRKHRRKLLLDIKKPMKSGWRATTYDPGAPSCVMGLVASTPRLQPGSSVGRIHVVVDAAATTRIFRGRRELLGTGRDAAAARASQAVSRRGYQSRL